MRLQLKVFAVGAMLLICVAHLARAQDAQSSGDARILMALTEPLVMCVGQARFPRIEVAWKSDDPAPSDEPPDIRWSSAADSIASVQPNSEVTGRKAGTTHITAKVQWGSVSASKVFPVSILPPCGDAQSPRVELDHVFIVVTPGAAAEIAALRAAGFTLPDEPPRKHDGQGTASTAVFFENAYLELIWVDSSVAVAPHAARTAEWFRQATSWRTNRHSPFGLGLHRMAGDTSALPVPVEREPAAWLPPGVAYELLRQPGDSLAADFFVVPAVTAVPTWIARARQREPQLWQHTNAARMISLVRVHGTPAQLPNALRAFRIGGIATQAATEPWLELILDGGTQGKRVDLRPTLPLVVVR